MKNNLIIAVLIAITLCSCSENKYEITSEQIGPLKKNERVSNLEKVFPKDSVVISESTSDYINSGTVINIYEKGTAKNLLQIIPTDDTKESGIGNVLIMDERFVTREGISIKSTFKEISDAYTVKRIDNLLEDIVVFVEEDNSYFTIDKKHLPSEYQYDTQKKVSTLEIPDTAPIKSFNIRW